MFSPTHELIAKFGVCGMGKGQFDGICGIVINSSGTIFVSERINKRLQSLHLRNITNDHTVYSQ